MSAATPTILIVDDELIVRASIREALEHQGYYVVEAGNLAQADNILSSTNLDAVLLDLQLGADNGTAFLEAHKAMLDDLPVIVLTGRGGAQSATAAKKLGAFDFVAKPGGDVLLGRLGEAVEKRRLSALAKPSSKGAELVPTEGQIIGRSQAIYDVATKVARLSKSDEPVLIQGEQGTGKELVAHELVANSLRANRPFKKCSAANISDTLAESELFGHFKGAFTGAHRETEGLVKAAHTGTLFLDEVGEMKATVQAALLRFLEEGQYHKVGGNQMFRADVRVIAATNRDLEEAMQQRTFRRDLFDRLNVTVIKLPPLRERTEDIPLLAEHFLRRAASRCGKPDLSFTPDALVFLEGHDWPGNVRELRNAVQRAVVSSWGKWITVVDIHAGLDKAAHSPTQTPASSPSARATTALAQRSLAEVEKEHIVRVLASTGGNRTKAATILRIDPKTLRNKIAEYRRSQAD